MNTIAIIPARYGSTRFPGKPLAHRTGKPLIQHVVEQVRLAERVGRVLVATDDQRIAEAVAGYGGEAILTRPDHPNGTSRIAEAVEHLEQSADESNPPPDIVVNVQGDEPELDPTVIDALVDGLIADPEAPMATLASPFETDEDPADPNIVKVAVNQHHRAAFFSRSLIPFNRDETGPARPLKHPGIYAYRRHFLFEYVSLPPTPLEQTEQLEQLRALEYGYPIAVVQTVVRYHGIDTPEQYEAFVQRQLAALQP